MAGVAPGVHLEADDPLYRGVKIPRRFYKVAAWTTSEPAGVQRRPRLDATAYVLDQTPPLVDVDLSGQQALRAGDVPPPVPYRTFQVPVGDVAALTGLDLGALPGADRFPDRGADTERVEPAPPGATPASGRADESLWRRLDGPADLIATVTVT